MHASTHNVAHSLPKRHQKLCYVQPLISYKAMSRAKNHAHTIYVDSVELHTAKFEWLHSQVLGRLCRTFLDTLSSKVVSWKRLPPSFIVKTCSQRCRENTGTLFASYLDEHTHPNDSLVARSRLSAQEAVVREPVLPLCSPLSVIFL